MGCTNSQEKLLIQSLTTEKNNLSTQNSTLLTQLTLLQSKQPESPELQSLKQQLSSLSTQLTTLKSCQKLWIFKSLSRTYNKFFIQTLSLTFNTWKTFSVLFEKSENFTLEPVDPDLYDEESLKTAEFLISQESSALLNSSPVKDLFSRHQDASVGQMSTQKILKFFEDMLDLKYSQDLRDLEDKRKPKTVPEFFIDFLYRSFGLKHLAHKSLNQMIPGLLNFANFSYFSLLCRLLQISELNPAGYAISLFLTKLRMDFNALQTKSSTKLTKYLQNSQILQNLQKTEGGAVYLNDAFVLVYTLFDKNRVARSLFIQLLQPETVTKEVYFLFHVSFKMARMPISPEDLFDLIDSKRLKTLKIKVLVNGISKILDLGLNAETLEILTSVLDPKNTQKISKETFVSMLSQKNYLKNVNSEKFIVSKFKFLNCALEVYNRVRVKALALMLWKLRDKEIDGGEGFKRVVKGLDEGVSEEFLEFLYEESGNCRENVAKGLVEYGIGDKRLKCFGKGYVVIAGLTLGFEKRRSEIIEDLLEI